MAARRRLMTAAMLGGAMLLTCCNDPQGHADMLLDKVIDLGVLPPVLSQIGFRIANETEFDWHVTSIESGCGALDVDVSEQRAVPGETILVTVTVDGRGAAGSDRGRCWLVQSDGSSLAFDLAWFIRGQAVARPAALVVNSDEHGTFTAAFDVYVPGFIDPPVIGVVAVFGDAAVDVIGPAREEYDRNRTRGTSQFVVPVKLSGSTLRGRRDEDRKVVVRLADFGNPYGDVIEVLIVCARRGIDVSPRVLILSASAAEQEVRLSIISPPLAGNRLMWEAEPPTLGIVEEIADGGDVLFRWSGQRAKEAALVFTLDGIRERVPILFAE